MGMYTEIFINADLKEGTPQEVIDVLAAMCQHNSKANCLKDKPQQWADLFSQGSFYLPLTECAKLTYSDIAGHYSLLAKGDIKNDNNEILQFFAFIKPWCKGDFIGYYRDENSIEPILVYTDDKE
ncbi:MAG: hypothetical protein ACPGPF_01500 [Pontibacterium sp.]